jgi:hypothetical protein
MSHFMTEQEAFLKQAASDYAVFRMLLDLDRDIVPACHPLHYLQMATEKLAKAAMIALGQPIERLTHIAFSQIPYALARTDIANRLGWKNGKAFRQFLKKSSPIFRKIDELNPSVGAQRAASMARQQPNVEYPWLVRDAAGDLSWQAPVVHEWPLIEQLRSGQGAQVLRFVEILLGRFGALF